MHRCALAAAALLVVPLALAGCSTPSPPPVTATVTATAAPPSASPFATASSPAPSATASASPASAACASNGGVLPPGASTAVAADLDGDGKADRIYSLQGKNTFGILTASGSLMAVQDALAGPAAHAGWATRLPDGAAILVTSDGRGANLDAIQRTGTRCSLGPVLNAQGKPYTFDMEDLRGNGTGVGCRTIGGRVELGGYQLSAIDGEHSKVLFTTVTVAADGRSARNGSTTVLAASASNDGALVRQARSSACGSAPIVASDGK